MKKFLLFLPIFGLAAFLGFSQQGEWYKGKIIKDIIFTGLANVPAADINTVTDAYKGRFFTDDLFLELQGKLYDLNYFESLVLSIDRAGRQDSDGVIIRFEVIENPMITEMAFEGGSFFSDDRLLLLLMRAGYKKNAIYSRHFGYLASTIIENFYGASGFRDTKVECIEHLKANNTCTVTYKIQEGNQYIIEAVRFEGNRAFTSRELTQCLVTRSKGVFFTGLARSSEFAEDTAAIGQYYGDRGYLIEYSGIPEIKESRVEGNMRYLTLTYKITNESERLIFGGFIFSGNRAFTNARLSALVQSKTNQAMNRSVMQNDVLGIQNLYYDAGYLDVSFNAETVIEGRVISYKITITEGDKISLEDIIIKGNQKISAEAIRGKIPLMPGDAFSKNKLEDGYQALSAMRVFSYVNFSPEPGGRNGWRKLIITVKER